jgi:MoaA/NifB/PqqE/SkfB family radical SAM enzyme
MSGSKSALYSNLKYLQFQDRISALRDGRLVAPVHIRIKPINRCNHNCWYCAYRVDNLQLGQDMVETDVLPEAKMMEIADDCIAMGVRAVTFSGGGEPLLYKPLPETIERMVRGGIKVAALTNGSNLKGRVAEAFAKYATWVRISIDAWDNESYSKARGVRDGEFDRVIENMREFAKSQSKCVLGVSFIVGKENYTRILDMCSLFKDAGVNHVSLSGAVVENDGHKNNLYHAEIFSDVQKRIAEASEKLSDEKFSIINNYHTLDERFDKAYNSCPMLQFRIVIGADSKVYTCQDKAYTNKGLLGSIETVSFKDFWFSEENLKKVRGINPSVDCNHHCVSHGRNISILDYLAIDQEHGVFV